MEWGIRFFLMVLFLVVFFQDVKERKVYWFLLVLLGLGCGILHYKNTLPMLFLTAAALNLLFVSILLLFVFLYSRFKLKTGIENAMGSGDILLFFCLSFSFATVSFMVVLISALIFSLVLHLLLKKKRTFETVPLAGYMSLFFAVTYMAHWLGLVEAVYKI